MWAVTSAILVVGEADIVHVCGAADHLPGARPSLGDFARLPRYQAGDEVPHNIADRISSRPLVGGRASPDGPFLLLLDVVKHCVVPFYDGLDVGWYGGTFSVR